jgi:hypothetical protein
VTTYGHERSGSHHQAAKTLPGKSQVFTLIEDLAELEVLENAEDLKDARASLAETNAGSPTVPYEQLHREAGLEN